MLGFFNVIMLLLFTLEIIFAIQQHNIFYEHYHIY